MLVLTQGKIAYFPITKNASSTFTEHFLSIGWQQTQLDVLDDSYEVFAHFRDPIERHFKGTAEFLCQHHIEHLIDDPTWQKVWSRCVMDLHSYPISWQVGDRRIHWILIKKGLDTVELTRAWLSDRGIDLGTVIWKNESNDHKNQVYQKLLDLYQTLQDKDRTLIYFYDADIVLWNKLGGFK